MSTPDRRDTAQAMSHENVDLMLELYDAFNRRDWDAGLALVDDEVEIESRLVAVEGGYHGHEGMRRWWNDFLGAFPDYTLDIEELRDLGEVTLRHIRGSGHAADSATPLVDPFWHPVRWRDGKVVWWRNCSTEAEALEAVRLRE
jgi:ketosteroid isomerase-like protein